MPNVHLLSSEIWSTMVYSNYEQSYSYEHLYIVTNYISIFCSLIFCFKPYNLTFLALLCFFCLLLISSSNFFFFFFGSHVLLGRILVLEQMVMMIKNLLVLSLPQDHLVMLIMKELCHHIKGISCMLLLLMRVLPAFFIFIFINSMKW